MNSMNRKFIFVMSLLCLHSAAFAFEYNCFSFDDNEPYGIENFVLKIVNQNSVKMTFAGYKFEETYTVSEYSPTRAPADSRQEVKFFITEPKNSYGEGPLSPFIADKDLLDGGYTLRNGKKGGFMKITGAGYRWAKYICYSQK